MSTLITHFNIRVRYFRCLELSIVQLYPNEQQHKETTTNGIVDSDAHLPVS